ncbi:MAG: hypothetical protein V4574_03915 [Pseudomonadota bacterium]
MIAVFLGTVLAFAGTPQDTEQVKVAPMSEEAAVGEFENACVRWVRDPDALGQTATRSIRAYVEGPAATSATGNKMRSWTSRFGTINYIEKSAGHDGKGFRECSFTAYTRDPVNRRVLNNELGSMAARRAAKRLREIEDDRAMAWMWSDQFDRRTALYSIADYRTPHQITLSLRSDDRTE